MVMEISYKKLPGYSKSFIEYLKNLPSSDSLFLMSGQSYNLDKIIKYHKNYRFDEHFVRIIEVIHKSLKKSQPQRDNLKLLRTNNAYVCTAYVKPGFMGGPTNQFLKVLSVIINCKLLSEKYPGKNFIPLIWLDDDAHDNFETSQAYIHSKKGDIEQIFCDDGLEKTSRTNISTLFFEKNINKKIDYIISLFNDNENSEKMNELLKKIYQPEKNWVSAFAELINYVFHRSGILFISSYLARKEGIFNNLTAEELMNRGKTLKLINATQSDLKKSGSLIKHKAFPYNLNIHKDDKVFKCQKKESVKLTHYSPNIMLRAVFQDSLMPSVFRIMSPSEVIYSGLLDKVYERFNVVQPISIPRYSVTFISGYVREFLDEYNTDISEISNSYKKLERMFDKNKQIKSSVSWIYPNHSMQERTLSLINILHESKKQFVTRTVDKLANKYSTSHYIIDL
jgi:bacillithiol synthase